MLLLEVAAGQTRCMITVGVVVEMRSIITITTIVNTHQDLSVAPTTTGTTLAGVMIVDTTIITTTQEEMVIDIRQRTTHHQGEHTAEWAKAIGITILGVFLLEQVRRGVLRAGRDGGHALVARSLLDPSLATRLLVQVLRMAAFGVAAFFSHVWFVADLLAVTFSLLCETALEEYAHHHHMVRLMVVLRLWMVVAFIFDMCLLEHEKGELAEMEEKKEHTHKKEL